MKREQLVVVQCRTAQRIASDNNNDDDNNNNKIITTVCVPLQDRLCGLVVGVPGYRLRVPGSIPGATRFSEKNWVWNGVH
jgi:hypothetical protein